MMEANRARDNSARPSAALAQPEKVTRRLTITVFKTASASIYGLSPSQKPRLKNNNTHFKCSPSAVPMMSGKDKQSKENKETRMLELHFYFFIRAYEKA